jgi:hypothetical protein
MKLPAKKPQRQLRDELELTAIQLELKLVAITAGFRH